MGLVALDSRVISGFWTSLTAIEAVICENVSAQVPVPWNHTSESAEFDPSWQRGPLQARARARTKSATLQTREPPRGNKDPPHPGEANARAHRGRGRTGGGGGLSILESEGAFCHDPAHPRVAPPAIPCLILDNGSSTSPVNMPLSEPTSSGTRGPAGIARVACAGRIATATIHVPGRHAAPTSVRCVLKSAAT